LVQPDNGTATSVEEAVRVAASIGYPVIVRPSYVLGGRAMKIVYNSEALENFTRLAIEASPEHPVLIDKFLEDAVEVDVDAICDGRQTIIGGIMEHVEEAGVHSGDSACILPPQSIPPTVLEEIAAATRAMAQELNVVGLMNVLCHQRAEGLRAGGQSPGFPNDSLCKQGHRGAPGQAGHQGHAG